MTEPSALGWSGTFGGRKSFFRGARSIAGQSKESSHAKSSQLDERRRLSPLPVEERPDGCRRQHLDECRGAEAVRAGEAHSRGRPISGPSKQWAAMFRLRSVRGPGFMQGRGGSGRRERLVPTLHGEARLEIGFHSRRVDEERNDAAHRVKALPSSGTVSTWNDVNSAEPDPKLVGTEIRYGT